MSVFVVCQKNLKVLCAALVLFCACPAFASETAIFAGGCFWCMEPPFDKLDGVLKTTSGFAGGAAGDATYEKVSSGSTSHLEVLQVTFDPAKVSYDKLLETYWKNIDPVDEKGQFCDKGSQYKSAIFALSPSQEASAKRSLEEIGKKLKRPIATQVLPRAEFYSAEEYHQDYYTKNPIRYKFYRSRCGRDARLKELWGNK